MIINFVCDILFSRKTNLKQKINELKKNYFFYKKLIKLLKDGNLYQNFQQDNGNVKEFMKQINENDENLLKNIFQENVREFLKTTKLKKEIRFLDSADFRQIGYGTILVRKPVKGLWTTGKALFYLPVFKGKSNKIEIEFFSIAPIQVQITFENTIVENVRLGILSSKKIQFVIEQEKIKDQTSQIVLETDRLWFPHKILGRGEGILVGVGINRIANVT